MIIKQSFNGSKLPEYHKGMLIMKVRSSAASMGILSITGAEGPLHTAGIAALSFFERGGLIKRVTSLSRSSQNIHPPMAMAGSTLSILADSASNEPDPNSGVNLVELEREQDVEDLQVALAKDPNIEFVSRVPIRYLAAAAKKKAEPVKKSRGRTSVRGSVSKTGIISEFQPPTTMWNLQKISWEMARGIPGFSDAFGVSVAVLDTGVDSDHPDLSGRISSYAFAHPDLPDSSGNKDIIGHGTHVSGTIAASFSNNLGIKGICTCELHVWKIFDDIEDFAGFDDGYVYFVDTAMYHRALAECLDRGIDVINLSIGGPGKPDPNERLLFDNLLAAGTTIVAAMGNERQFGSPTSYPAAIPGVIAVGATNINDSVANFSNRGNHISVSAPGVSIWSTLPTYPGRFGFSAVLGADGSPRRGMEQKRETHYASWDGTSMASPHVAAAVALLIANKGKMNPAEVRARLMASADHVAGMNGNGFHPDYGAGRLNLLNLLN